MKTLRVPLALLLLTGSIANSQTPVPEAGAAAETAPAVVMRTPQELEQLLGPIALYPDALIAIILPATTAPADIVLAARYVREFPDDRSQIEHRAWDDSVKSLTNYPDVLKWMDDNLQWTKQVGEAFAAQPADVMQAIQRLRAQARAAGTLTDTPQQQVIAEPEAIRIVPAQPDVIYVPQYQPEVVFVDRPVYYSQPFITFGVGVPVGSWLAFDCDWRRHTIWVGDRHRLWTGHDWHRPLVPFGPVYSGPHFTRTQVARQWRPSLSAPRTVVNINYRSPAPIARPAPFNASVARSHGYAPRPAGFAEVRAPTPPQTTQPAQPSVSAPRNYGSGGHRRPSNSPASSTAVATSPAATPPTPIAAASFAPSVVNTAPITQPASPAPAQRRSGVEWSRDRSDNRVQTYPHSRGAGNQGAPALAAPVVSAPIVSAPASQPAMPVSVPRSAPAQGYTYSRQPHVVSTPNVAVSAPVHHHQPAPVVAAPVQAAPAPAPAPQAAAPAQSAPANNSNASNGGHRGGGGRGRNIQEN
jgi:hypothetical protein